jgi:methyltransferase (TIGR00027 family)
MAKPEIENVSDTAHWVATYRAIESLRKDALFKDPFAAQLAGARGKQIASTIDRGQYVQWQVVIRTHIIDQFILERIQSGVDVVVNLGAGLDTRPYRLDLPAQLQWIEVDFAGITDFKEKELALEVPKCRLEKMRVDLSDPEASKKCLKEIAKRSKNILVITEGVVPYLTNAQVAELATNLYAEPSFQFWICEYLSEKAVKFLHKHRIKDMVKAPFQFAPIEWNAFFKEKGWVVKESKYIAIESRKLGRPIPSPWWAKLMLILVPMKKRMEIAKFSGYQILERISL